MGYINCVVVNQLACEIYICVHLSPITIMQILYHRLSQMNAIMMASSFTKTSMISIMKKKQLPGDLNIVVGNADTFYGINV